MRGRGRAVGLVLAGAIVLAVVGPGAADGPWKGQIVDAETKRPLPGVVVLMYWLKRYSTPAGWAGSELWDAEEAVTDAEGRFEIAARSTVTLTPLAGVSGPWTVIYKPGYGQWRFRGAEEWPMDSLRAYERKALVDAAWAQLKGAGAVIELSPLKTRKERLEFLREVSWARLVPLERTRRMDEAKDQERAYLGLPVR